MIRIHQIGVNQALDRRRIEELFLEASNRVSNITRWSFGDEVLKRTEFEVHSFSDMYFNFDGSLKYDVPDYSNRVPSTSVNFRVRGSYYESRIAWSVELDVTGPDSYFAAGWPVINGEPVWTLLDYKQSGTLKLYTGEADPPTPDVENADTGYSAGSPFGDQDLLTLGQQGVYTGLPGDGQTSIFLLTVGSWRVLKSSFSMEVRYR